MGKFVVKLDIYTGIFVAKLDLWDKVLHLNI